MAQTYVNVYMYIFIYVHYVYTHTHTHTHPCMCVCACSCACVRVLSVEFFIIVHKAVSFHTNRCYTAIVLDVLM